MLDKPARFHFGDLVLDCAQHRLVRAGQDLYLPPKTFELLVYLIQHRGRAIPKGELLDAVWPNVNVVENTLAQRVREIRETLGERAHGAEFIKTIPRVGYQFTAELDEDVSRSAPLERPTEPRRGWTVLALLVVLGAVLVPARWTREKPVRISDHRLVSDVPRAERFPTLSPDGSTMAFVDDVNGRPQVWVRSLSGGQRTQLTFVDGLDIGWTRWSPTGDRIYFNYEGGIWTVSPFGGTPHRVVARGKNPSVAGNGTTLVYEGLGMPDGDLGIWLASADGAPATRVLNRPYAIASMPAVAPDGRSIVFVRSSGGPLGDLWIVPTTGGAPRRLTYDDAEIAAPTWTPDGKFVIFSSKRSGSRTLWRVAAAGGEPTPLTAGAGDDSDPQISSDGRSLIYTNVRSIFRLEVLDTATGRRGVLTERRTLISAPRFSPDGSRITFFHETDTGIHLFTINVDGHGIRPLTINKGERNLLPRWSASGDVLFFSQVLPKPSFRRVAVVGGDSTEVGPWPWDAWVELDPQERAIVYQKGNATLVRWLEGDLEKRLLRRIDRPRWSPDGTTIFGTEVVQRSDNIGGNVVACQISTRDCRIVTNGHGPALAPDGRTLYFMRPGKRNMTELWVTDIQEPSERYLGEIGPFRLPDFFIDVSRQHLVAWCAFHQGKPETWLAEIR